VDYYEENDLWLLVRRNQLPDGETSTLITTKLVAPQRPIEWTWLAGSLAEMFPPRRNIRTNFLFGFSLTIVSSYSVSNHYYFSFYGSLLFLRSCHRCCPLEHPLALRSDVTFQIWSIHRAKHFAMRDSLVHFLFTGFVCNNEDKKNWQLIKWIPPLYLFKWSSYWNRRKFSDSSSLFHHRWVLSNETFWYSRVETI
jgi:hypothetical protein